MLSMLLMYLILMVIFFVAGVGVWILRGRGFSEFRRSGGAPPSAGTSRDERGQH